MMRRTKTPPTPQASTFSPPARANPFLILRRVEQDPVDLDLLTAALGVRLIRRPLDPNLCLILDPSAADPDGMDWTLRVNSDHAESRTRFSIAHALGHLVMHRRLIGPGLCDDRGYRCPPDGPRPNPAIGPEEETLANRVAVGILMPAEAVARRHAENPDADALARHFRTSGRAMRIRLDALGLAAPVGA